MPQAEMPWDKIVRENDELERLLVRTQALCKKRDAARATVRQLRQELPAMQGRLTGGLYIDARAEAIELEEKIETAQRELKREVLVRNELIDRTVAAAKTFVAHVIAIEQAQFGILRDKIEAAEAEAEDLQPDPHRMRGTPEVEAALMRPVREAKHRASEWNERLVDAHMGSCSDNRVHWMEKLLGPESLVKD